MKLPRLPNLKKNGGKRGKMPGAADDEAITVKNIFGPYKYK